MGAALSPGCPSGHGPGLGTPEDSLFTSLRALPGEEQGSISYQRAASRREIRNRNEVQKMCPGLGSESPLLSQTDSQFWLLPEEDVEPFEDGTQPLLVGPRDEDSNMSMFSEDFPRRVTHPKIICGKCPFRDKVKLLCREKSTSTALTEFLPKHINTPCPLIDTCIDIFKTLPGGTVELEG